MEQGDLVEVEIKVAKLGLGKVKGVICEYIPGSFFIIRAIEGGVTKEGIPSHMLKAYSSNIKLLEKNHREVIKRPEVGPYYYEFKE